jgi:glutamate synthase domain-containing protein 2
VKDSTLAKITASVAAARGIAQKALAASPNPQWTEYEIQSIDEWIAGQDIKLDRSEAIRRLVELGLKAKGN